MGKCEHKNVCSQCSLRMRLILGDKSCSICKGVSEEVVLSSNIDLDWDDFEDEIRRHDLKDRYDESLFYDGEKARAEGMRLRILTCPIRGCGDRKRHGSVDLLRMHMETAHQKTFCKICLKGRTVFIREQRIYHVKALRNHINHGDPANERDSEILPHPWCDFCGEFFYNDLSFMDHLSKMHLNCHLCGDYYKNMFYEGYESLEKHFAKTHYACPYDQCKQKCYVAF